MTAQIQAELAQLRPLLNGTIIALLHAAPTANNLHPPGFGFIVLAKTGRKFNVWVDCDPEGNGPGHLNIAPSR